MKKYSKKKITKSGRALAEMLYRDQFCIGISDSAEIKQNIDVVNYWRENIPINDCPGSQSLIL